MNSVAEAIQPLVGQLCWGVKPGVDQVLMMDFGEPHLDVHQPRVSTSTSERVRRSAARRNVYLHGAWALISHVCWWELQRPGLPAVGLATDSAELREPLLDLDGQRLERFEYDATTAQLILRFDLGAVVVLQPHTDTEPDDELWALYQPGQMVFSLRADGLVCHQPGDTPHGEESWRAEETTG